jgi:hypothetical protein
MEQTMTELLERTDQRNLQAQLIARAWYDESFKEWLLTDPNAAIEEELHLRLPDDIQVTVIEETPHTLVLLLLGKGCSLFGDHSNGGAERTTVRERDLRTELMAKANRDEAFRAELRADPRRAIEKELGIRLPEHLRVTVAEQTPTQEFLLLPINRTVLGEEPLNAPAGGTTGDCATNCCASACYCSSYYCSSISGCGSVSSSACDCATGSQSGCTTYSNCSNSNCCS